jgi:hypothetical protein
MDLGLGIGMLVFLYILYVLLIKGLLWKIIFVVVGWIGIYSWLKTIPTFQVCPVTISDWTFSWAFVVPTILVMLVLAHTKEE